MPNRGAPDDISLTIDISPFLQADYGLELNYDLILEGKSKTIDVPGEGRFITLSPGLHVTLHNRDTDELSRPINISGPTFTTFNEDGSTDVVVTGRSLNEDPFIRDGNAGFVFVSGRFSFSFDAEGNLSEPLNGNGHIVDFLDLAI